MPEISTITFDDTYGWVSLELARRAGEQGGASGVIVVQNNQVIGLDITRGKLPRPDCSRKYLRCGKPHSEWATGERLIPPSGDSSLRDVCWCFVNARVTRLVYGCRPESGCGR